MYFGHNRGVDYLSYEQFGVSFVRYAVTPERVAASMADVAGEAVEVGPLPAGPGGIATVKATGQIGAIEVTPDPGDILRFRAVLPIELDLEVRLGPVPNRYNGEVKVPLALTVRAAAPLMLVIDIDPITPRDVHVDLQSSSVGGDVIQRVGNMDAEVQAQVAKVVNERINSERAMETRVIDVAALVDESWAD